MPIHRLESDITGNGRIHRCRGIRENAPPESTHRERTTQVFVIADIKPLDIEFGMSGNIGLESFPFFAAERTSNCKSRLQSRG